MNKLPAKLPPTWRPWGTPAHFIVALWVFFFAALIALGQEPEHPLKPPDRLSPRAALKTFLGDQDAVGAFLARDYLPSPSRAEFHHLFSLVEAAVVGVCGTDVEIADGKYGWAPPGKTRLVLGHVRYVESEVVVRGEHSCQSIPAAIAEVRRIPHEHLKQVDSGPGGIRSEPGSTQ